MSDIRSFGGPAVELLAPETWCFFCDFAAVYNFYAWGIIYHKVTKIYGRKYIYFFINRFLFTLYIGHIWTLVQNTICSYYKQGRLGVTERSHEIPCCAPVFCTSASS